MRKYFLIVWFTAAWPLAAFGDSGTTALGSLAAQTDARLRSMGDVRAAVGDGIDTIYANPAMLAHQRFIVVGGSSGDKVQNVGSNDLAFILPLTGVHSSSLTDFGAFGFSASRTNFGDIDTRDTTGAPVGSFSASDTLFRVGYGLPLWRWVSLGANMTYFDSKIADRTATGWARDFGTRIGPEKGRWSVGLTVENQGDGVDFGGQSSKLPTLYRAGVSVVPVMDRLLIAADVVDPEEGKTSLKSGVEWWFADLLALRLGYDSEPDLGSGFSVGMGLRVNNMEFGFFPIRQFRLDYSFFSADALKEGSTNAASGTHRVSISFQFGEDDRITK